MQHLHNHLKNDIIIFLHIKYHSVHLRDRTVPEYFLEKVTRYSINNLIFMEPQLPK